MKISRWRLNYGGQCINNLQSLDLYLTPIFLIKFGISLRETNAPSLTK